MPTAAMVSGSPSTSASFASTSTRTEVACAVAAPSGLATGASLTGETESVTVAESVLVPSPTSYENESAPW
jgi:hypothetical protein